MAVNKTAVSAETKVSDNSSTANETRAVAAFWAHRQGELTAWAAVSRVKPLGDRAVVVYSWK